MQDNLKRTFIAIKVIPDRNFLNEYQRIQNRLQAESIRWVKPEHLHITLRFLGDIPEHEIDNISGMLEKGLQGAASFNFSVTGMDVFRSIRYPRVLWLGLTNTHDLHKLKSKVDESLGSLLKEHENNTFSPHLTLGRMKRIMNREILRELINDYRDFEFIKVQVNEVLFIESLLTKEGAAYKVISEHTLFPQSTFSVPPQ